MCLVLPGLTCKPIGCAKYRTMGGFVQTIILLHSTQVQSNTNTVHMILTLYTNVHHCIHLQTPHYMPTQTYTHTYHKHHYIHLFNYLYGTHSSAIYIHTTYTNTTIYVHPHTLTQTPLYTYIHTHLHKHHSIYTSL